MSEMGRGIWPQLVTKCVKNILTVKNPEITPPVISDGRPEHVYWSAPWHNQDATQSAEVYTV